MSNIEIRNKSEIQMIEMNRRLQAGWRGGGGGIDSVVVGWHDGDECAGISGGDDS
jgi:hypothetical protein